MPAPRRLQRGGGRGPRCAARSRRTLGRAGGGRLRACGRFGRDGRKIVLFALAGGTRVDRRLHRGEAAHELRAHLLELVGVQQRRAGARAGSAGRGARRRGWRLRSPRAPARARRSALRSAPALAASAASSPARAGGSAADVQRGRHARAGRRPSSRAARAALGRDACASARRGLAVARARHERAAAVLRSRSARPARAAA